MFSKNETSEVLSEIIKVDPTFDSEEFLNYVYNIMIPNILEVSLMILLHSF